MGMIDFPVPYPDQCGSPCHKTVAYTGMSSPGPGPDYPQLSSLRLATYPMKTATDPSTDLTPDHDDSGILLKPAK